MDLSWMAWTQPTAIFFAVIASLLLTTESLVADKPEDEPAMPGGGMPDMGGMGGMM